jgi:hypothetical protein
MAYALMSNREFHQATHCYATLHTGERVNYGFVSREVKLMRGNGGLADVPMVKIRKLGEPSDPGGWYQMNALFFVMPDGTVRR